MGCCGSRALAAPRAPVKTGLPDGEHHHVDGLHGDEVRGAVQDEEGGDQEVPREEGHQEGDDVQGENQDGQHDYHQLDGEEEGHLAHLDGVLGLLEVGPGIVLLDEGPDEGPLGGDGDDEVGQVGQVIHESPQVGEGEHHAVQGEEDVAAIVRDKVHHLSYPQQEALLQTLCALKSPSHEQESTPQQDELEQLPDKIVARMTFLDLRQTRQLLDVLDLLAWESGDVWQHILTDPFNHELEETTFIGPVWCSACQGFLWGLSRQGKRCGRCQAAVCAPCSKHSAPCHVAADQAKEERVRAAGRDAAAAAAAYGSHGAIGLDLCTWNQSASHAASGRSSSLGHVSGRQRPGPVVAACISFRTPELGKLEVRRTARCIRDLLALYEGYTVTSYRVFHHWFPEAAGASNSRGLERHGPGLCHAFIILTASIRGGEGTQRVHLLVEEFADKLELLMSRDAALEAYGKCFRATEDERPVGSRPVTGDEVVVLRVEDDASRVTLGDLREWLAGPLAMASQQYSVMARNCQHLVSSLKEFLEGKFTLAQLREALSIEKQAVLLAVRSDGTTLQYASEALRDDEEVATEALLQTGDAYEFVSAWLKERSSDMSGLHRLHRVLRDSDVEAVTAAFAGLSADVRSRVPKQVILLAVQCDGALLKFASEALRDDEEIVTAALLQSGDACMFVSASLKERSSDVSSLHLLHNALRTSDVESVREAMGRLSPDVQRQVPKQVILLAVQCDGALLKFASEALRDDEEVVTAALLQSGDACDFVSALLKERSSDVSNLHILHNALRTSDVEAVREAMGRLSPDLRRQIPKQVIVLAVQCDGALLKFASEALRDDEEVAMAALLQSGDACEFVSASLKQHSSDVSSLNLLHTAFSNSDVDAVGEAIGGLGSLTSFRLDLRKNLISEAVADSLASAISSMKQVTDVRLSLKGTTMSNLGVESILTACKQCSALRHLELDTVDQRSLVHMQHVLELLPQLERAEIPGVVSLDPSIASFKLKLNLHDKALGDAGAASLASALRRLGRLTALELWLQNDSIGAAGAGSLAGALRELRQLTSLRLDLAHNDIGAAGAGSLAGALRELRQLTTLRLFLQGNAVGAAGEAEVRAAVGALGRLAAARTQLHFD